MNHPKSRDKRVIKEGLDIDYVRVFECSSTRACEPNAGGGAAACDGEGSALQRRLSHEAQAMQQHVRNVGGYKHAEDAILNLAQSLRQPTTKA